MDQHFPCFYLHAGDAKLNHSSAATSLQEAEMPHVGGIIFPHLALHPCKMQFLNLILFILIFMCIQVQNFVCPWPSNPLWLFFELQCSKITDFT